MHNLLLQILIALLPIGTFQIWYNRPGKARHIPLMISLVCGLSMLLGLYYSINCNGILFDLSVVSYLIGSLYGGLPAASVLSIIFLAAKLQECSSTPEYIMLGVFSLIWIPALFKTIHPFQQATRNRKLRMVYRFTAFLIFAELTCSLYSYNVWHHPRSVMMMLGVYLIAFALVIILSVYYVELGFERVQLQTQFREISIKYRNEARRLQQFIDMAPLVVIFVDCNRLISHANDLALKLLNAEPRDVLGRDYRHILKRFDNGAALSFLERVLDGEDQVAEVLKIQERILYTTACPIWEVWGQKREGVMLIAHDMTELQQLKDEVDQMERLSLVGQMAASITHEIRNPMAVIRGFVQLLNERSPRDQQSYFRIVLDELDRANAIINDFLSLAQNRIVEKEKGDLHTVLKDMLPLIWADANMRGQSIDLKLSSNVTLLEMNVVEIKQLILNLARNGMEAMDEKGILRIETYDLPDRVELKVSDTGVGIEEEKLKRLFEPFFTTKVQGTGLGLALCQSIVERHQGRIEVDSIVGQGTSFLVAFPKQGYSLAANSA